MRVIASGRKTSRTTRLIEMAAEFERKGEVSYIVCGTHDQAYRIAQKAKELDFSISFPITYEEFRNLSVSSGRNIKHLLIDNADHFLQSLTPVHIAAIVVEAEIVG